MLQYTETRTHRLAAIVVAGMLAGGEVLRILFKEEPGKQTSGEVLALPAATFLFGMINVLLCFALIRVESRILRIVNISVVVASLPGMLFPSAWALLGFLVFGLLFLISSTRIRDSRGGGCPDDSTVRP
jgi:hypothetical protein